MSEEPKYCPPMGLLAVLFILALAILFHAILTEQDEHQTELIHLEYRIQELEKKYDEP